MHLISFADDTAFTLNKNCFERNFESQVFQDRAKNSLLATCKGLTRYGEFANTQEMFWNSLETNL